MGDCVLLLKARTGGNGLQKILSDPQEGIRLLGLSLLNLSEGKSYQGRWMDREAVLVLLQGDAQVKAGDHNFTGLHRDGVFHQKATSVYVPVGVPFEVENTGSERAEFALCTTVVSELEERLQPFAVYPDEVQDRRVGRENWQREVHDIMVANVEGRVQRIIVGETFNQPGNWSSFPPHKHDDYQPGVEACMEEVYHYRLDPPGGFGVQLIYTADRSLDEAYTVRDRDTFLVPRGYHPLSAAGGYRLYYLWMMAGETGRTMIPHDDPDYAWLK